MDEKPRKAVAWHLALIILQTLQCSLGECLAVALLVGTFFSVYVVELEGVVVIVVVVVAVGKIGLTALKSLV